MIMSHFRLCYRDPGQRFNVVIMEAPSMIHARLKAALAARDGGMIFTEGHELGAEESARSPVFSKRGQFQDLSLIHI